MDLGTEILPGYQISVAVNSVMDYIDDVDRLVLLLLVVIAQHFTVFELTWKLGLGYLVVAANHLGQSS